MARIMVFQHVATEPLGNLNHLIRSHKHRIRYINFARDPECRPSLKDYDALIVLGGPMNVTDIDNHPYLHTEIELIRSALDQELPILGICLGSQLLAHTLGAKVYAAEKREIGWYRLNPTNAGQTDVLTRHFQNEEMIFQWHGQTFELPENAEHLVVGQDCVNQAFRYNHNAYGFQFHLEVTPALIERWLTTPSFQQELDEQDPHLHMQTVRKDTEIYIERSLDLSRAVFSSFLQLLPKSRSTLSTRS